MNACIERPRRTQASEHAASAVRDMLNAVGELQGAMSNLLAITPDHHLAGDIEGHTTLMEWFAEAIGTPIPGAAPIDEDQAAAEVRLMRAASRVVVAMGVFWRKHPRCSCHVCKAVRGMIEVHRSFEEYLYCELRTDVATAAGRQYSTCN